MTEIAQSCPSQKSMSSHKSSEDEFNDFMNAEDDPEILVHYDFDFSPNFKPPKSKVTRVPVSPSASIHLFKSTTVVNSDGSIDSKADVDSKLATQVETKVDPIAYDLRLPKHSSNVASTSKSVPNPPKPAKTKPPSSKYAKPAKVVSPTSSKQAPAKTSNNNNQNNSKMLKPVSSLKTSPKPDKSSKPSCLKPKPSFSVPDYHLKSGKQQPLPKKSATTSGKSSNTFSNKVNTYESRNSKYASSMRVTNATLSFSRKNTMNAVYDNDVSFNRHKRQQYNNRNQFSNQNLFSNQNCFATKHHFQKSNRFGNSNLRYQNQFQNQNRFGNHSRHQPSNKFQQQIANLSQFYNHQSTNFVFSPKQSFSRFTKTSPKPLSNANKQSMLTPKQQSVPNPKPTKPSKKTITKPESKPAVQVDTPKASPYKTTLVALTSDTTNQSGPTRVPKPSNA